LLHPELLKLCLPAVCLETLHVRAALKAQPTPPTWRTHSALRTGWFRRAHIKSESCYRLRLLLTPPAQFELKFLFLESAIRHSLKAFGIRSIKGVGRAVLPGRCATRCRAMRWSLN
jgi:transposase